ncbi:MAG: hypothetical protein O3A46_01145 [Candidatus Poribacteria bacterium]|nr:hypothetical protein [Candidatus Poribacteria bacterium]
MLRLPRLRDLDPDLTRQHLPFYLRTEWLFIGVAAAILSHFFWALATIVERPFDYRFYLQLSVSVFVTASSFGYFYARVGSRFLGVSWLRILRGKERIFDTRLGRMTVAVGVALAVLPQVINGLLAAEFLLPVPFYSGAIVGMSVSFFLWVIGLPR